MSTSVRYPTHPAIVHEPLSSVLAISHESLVARDEMLAIQERSDCQIDRS
jgi:hypothetical protein